MRTQVIGVNPSMDDRRILAEMERHLARDAPELASLMDALNRQFPEDGHENESDNKASHEWYGKLAIVLAVVAVVGMLLTAILSGQTSPDDNQSPPHGVTPAHSLHMQRRVLPATPAKGRRAQRSATPRHARDGIPTLSPEAVGRISRRRPPVTPCQLRSPPLRPIRSPRR
ncbi:DUF3040 domain-containing protein [Streptomyces sp. NPDC018833]|uniref:DUF3040 domain-containing protein n=1 Tax=Streptomyces sp. NPDC018833 TaxID=3365053 RepID=UPI0037BC79A1